jgi:hypothetical protein
MVCLPSESIGDAYNATDAFEVDAAIASFLADPKRESLELPRSLSAEQRKHAKKMVEMHQEHLKCESFGLGAERQMFVFKCIADENNPQNSVKGARFSDRSPVSVKNTFIDDWIPEFGCPADERNVQSMPHNMFAKSLAAEFAGASIANEEVSAIANTTVVEECSYAVGTEVIIDGLVKAPMFNGAQGVVQSWDAETGRFNILLTFATSSGHTHAKVKGENLRLA